MAEHPVGVGCWERHQWTHAEDLGCWTTLEGLARISELLKETTFYKFKYSHNCSELGLLTSIKYVVLNSNGTKILYLLTTSFQ